MKIKVWIVQNYFHIIKIGQNSLSFGRFNHQNNDEDINRGSDKNRIYMIDILDKNLKHNDEIKDSKLIEIDEQKYIIKTFEDIVI